MKKYLKRFLQILLFCFIVLVVVFILVGKLTLSGVKKTESNTYTTVLGNISTNPRVVDIAMLGAHDAFSHNITTKSAIDPSEDGILTNKTASLFLDGLMVRLAKAQKSDALTLFNSGVRYFDIRLSYIDGMWYTKHGFISNEFDYYLKDLIIALENSVSEFVILDFQHIYFGEATYVDLYLYLESFKINNKSILDFLHYNPLSTSLGELTFDQVTLNKTQSGAVILMKNGTNSIHYDYYTSIRSNWHDVNDSKILLSKMKLEYDSVDNFDIFRVNQAQLTGAYAPNKLLKTLIGWSLLSMADEVNYQLVELDYFDRLPILMVDYADSNNHDFNKRIIEKIIAFNNNLQ